MPSLYDNHLVDEVCQKSNETSVTNYIFSMPNNKLHSFLFRVISLYCPFPHLYVLLRSLFLNSIIMALVNAFNAFKMGSLYDLLYFGNKENVKQSKISQLTIAIHLLS